MKKVILGICSVVLIGVLIYAGSNFTSSKKDSKTINGTNEVSNQKENDTVVANDLESYSNPVVDYLKKIKIDNGTQLYFEKLEKAKALITPALYEELMPNLTTDQKNLLLQENKERKESYTSNVSDFEISYMMIGKDEQLINVIYTYQALAGTALNKSRYLFRAKVERIDEKYMISEILEDSQLIDGIYQKLK